MTKDLTTRDPLTASTVPLSPILSAALDAFYENGYHGASVRDIAARVGVTVPALYYHHANKEAMLYALLDVSIGMVESSCAAVARERTDPAERFLDIVECLVRHMAVSGKLAYLDAEIRFLAPAHRESYIAKRDAVEAMLLHAVEEGTAIGRFAGVYPRDAVRALLGMVQAIAVWFRPAGELSLDQLVERYRAISSRMIGLRTP